MNNPRVSCPGCGQEVYLSERVCPFCNTPLSASSSGSALSPVEHHLPPPDLRERILSLPLWAVAGVVVAAGVMDGVVVAVAVRTLQQGPLGHYDLLARLGALAIPVMVATTLLRWLFDTLILWIAVRITGSIAGEPFQVGFLEGYRNMLAITMLMVLNSSIVLLLALITGFWLLLIAAWFVDLLILRHFLEMDWYEVFLLNAVLGFFSCVTGGLL